MENLFNDQIESIAKQAQAALKKYPALLKKAQKAGPRQMKLKRLPFEKLEILPSNNGTAFVAMIPCPSGTRFFIGTVVDKSIKNSLPNLKIVKEITLEQAQNAIDHPLYFKVLCENQ